MEIVGLRGAPEETFKEMRRALKTTHGSSLSVYLVTDWQGNRENQRYALYIRGPKSPILSADAFGPAFGQAGQAKLVELVDWLLAHGVTHWYETVLPPSVYTQVLLQVPPDSEQRIMVGGNPTDPNIYAPAT